MDKAHPNTGIEEKSGILSEVQETKQKKKMCGQNHKKKSKLEKNTKIKQKIKHKFYKKGTLYTLERKKENSIIF